MSDIFASPFFGITISILAFFIGLEIQKRTKIALCNPLLLAIILVIVFLKIFGIPYDDYNEGGAIINMFLAPATACLAVSIYTKRRNPEGKLAAHSGRLYCRLSGLHGQCPRHVPSVRPG